MTNTLIDTISRLVQKYFNDLKAGGVECRLVLPALTENIATGLQDSLVAQGLPSYLVVPKSKLPDATKRWIRAEGVTSVRQGDMIVIVWPGEMSRIQDSVIGAGGAMRNFAFSDEWPWIDSNNEYFQFEGPVLNAVLAHWNVHKDDIEAYSTILLAARDTCRDSLLRGVVFLDRILGGFDPLAQASIENNIDRLLFHLGIPRPENHAWHDKSTLAQFFSDVRRVTKELETRISDIDGKQELLSRIPDIETDKQTALRIADTFGQVVDSFTIRGDDRQEGLLALHGCWGTADAWKDWSLSRLQALLDVTPTEEHVNIRALIGTNSGIVAEDGKSVVLIEGGHVAIDIIYDGLIGEQANTNILILDRARELLRQACTGISGQIHVELHHDELFGQHSSGRKKSLRIIARRGQNDLATARVTIIPSGPNQPLIAIMDPGFKVYLGSHTSRSADPKDGVEKTEVNEPVRFTVVSWGGFDDGEVEIDDTPVALNKDPENPHIFRLPDFVDPSTSGLGHCNIDIRASGLEIAIDVEAKNIVRGEFTLERELIIQLASMSDGAGHRSAVKRIVDIFAGKKDGPYPGLGGLDDSSRSRIRLAKFFEADTGGCPIITNLLQEQLRSQGTIDTLFARCDLDLVPTVFERTTIHPKVEELIFKYTSARQTALDIIYENSQRNTLWPDYASLPIFVETKHERLEKALLTYLTAYLEILVYAQSNLAKLSWPELFRLACVDCVVHWDGSASSRKVILIGPWHPIVVSKRFMVQSTLFASARHHLSLKNDAKTHVLALLLDQVNSLRWFAALAADGTTFESYYVSSSSDPGWLVAIAHDIVGGPDYLKFTSSLRRFHGLETGLMPSSRDQVARGYLQDFFNAYPTKRAISVIADESYSPSRLVESAQSLLYEGDVVSRVGRQLPGGIHIAAPDPEDLDAQEWRTPPVCLYGVNGLAVTRRPFNDVHLLSPGRAKSTRDPGNRISLPRGHGILAAFSSPVKEVGAWADGILNSRAFERDTAPVIGDTLGDSFTQVCSLLAKLPGEERVMSWQADLPPSLDHLWTVIPGNHVDPAVFVRYVSEATKRGESTALWDYSMSLTGALNSYFVLSRIPSSVSYELNKSPVLDGKPLAPAVLEELGRVGMALGSESLRSGSKALGVIGVVAAVRLILPEDITSSPIRNNEYLRGFLLPVDSFREILGGSLDSKEPGQRQRADLVAIQLGLLNDGFIGISSCAIECKYSSNTFGQDQVNAAVQQAQSTLRRLLELIEASKANSGIPERLALLSLISFGLRLSQEQLGISTEESNNLEAQILQRILDGKIRVISPKAAKIVVITDCTAIRASWSHGQGLVIKLGPGHWPGVSESSELQEVRDRLSQEFDPIFTAATSNTDSSITRVEKPLATPCLVPEGLQEHDSSEAADDGAIDAIVTPETIAVVPTQAELPLDGCSEKKIAKPSAHGPLNPILLGTAGHEHYFYDPQNRETPLDNYNVMITGSSGKGKTQLIKTIVSRLREQRRNVLLLDFKNDFASDAHFVKQASLQCQYVTFDGLPFNPLIPVPLRRPGSLKEYLPISEHINGLVDIFKKTFGLGDQQEVAVKNAIRECFEERGIQPRGAVEVTADLDYPDFNDVGDKLRETNQNAYNRLDPLFDLGIFPPSSRLNRFDSMLNNSLVVDLSQIQSDRIKNAVAKILVMSAHRYYNAKEHSGNLRQFFVFDEAHRVLDSEFLLQFVRECRAYGVGVLLSSQYPTDFPADVSASLNTKIIHGNGADKDRVRDISRIVGGIVAEEEILHLSMFQAIVTNSQYTPIITKTIGYPMMLVLDAIRDAEGISRNDLQVEGVDPTRLDVSYLITALMEMGLVEERSKKLYLLK